MSRHSPHYDHNRFDSALDLSHNGGHTSYEDFEDTQTVAASTVMAPWSQYNTRFESDQVSPHGPSYWNPRSHTFSIQDPIGNPTQAYQGNFSPAGPLLGHGSPDAAALYISSPATSLRFDTASHPIASSALPTRTPAPRDTIPCSQCGQIFTGEYRTGNLGRHTRQKHPITDRSLYQCKGCSKVFQRQDARLKHTRKRHPELCIPPVQRPQSTAQHPTRRSVDDVHVPHHLDYNVGQWSQSDNILAGSYVHEGEDEANSAAQYVLTNVEAELHPADYSRSCDSFFTRWESIVQELFERQSEAHPLYAQVLEDIRAVVHANNIAHTACSGSNGPTSRATHEQRAAPRGNGNTTLGPGANRVNKRGERESSSSRGPDKNTMVGLGEKSNRQRQTQVDCPIFKHHIMHNSQPPCRGCRVGVMAQVRSHLNPNRTGIHRGFPEFIQQCSRCKQDFVERHLYDEHITASACVPQNQIRGDMTIPWARQYLALYPNARRIPLPWPNQRGWLPNSVLTQCRAPVTNSNVASPFLGEPQGHNNPQPQTPAETTRNLTEGPWYMVAMGHMLNDFVQPTYTLRPRSSTPAHNPNRSSATDLGSPVDGSFGSNNRYWQNILRSFRTNQRTMREGAPYLTPAQLQYMVAELEQMFNISHDLSQQYQSPSPQVQIYHTPNYEGTTANSEGLSTQGSNTTYQTPAQPQHFHTLNYDEYTPSSSGTVDGFMTPSTTTLPSHASNGAGSSLRPNSTLTYPSSDYPPSDPRLLSPFSPTGYRRTSLPPDVVQDGPRSRPVLPGPRSLPDNSEGTIDPTVLSGNNADYDDFVRRYYGGWS